MRRNDIRRSFARGIFLEPWTRRASDESSLSRLNVAALRRVCNYLGIAFAYEYVFEMGLDLGEVRGPWDWALRIAEATGAIDSIERGSRAGRAFTDSRGIARVSNEEMP